MKKLLESRLFLPVLVYLIAMGMILYYNLTHELVNDGVYEYLAYLSNIKYGWTYQETLVNSAVIAVWVPAILHKITGLDAMLVFRVWPTLLYPLMPTFTFLIARRYLGTLMTLTATALMLVNSHFLFFPDIGRVGIALGFFAGTIWALLNRRVAWCIIFAVLVVLSHYALSIIAIGLLVLVVLGTLVIRRGVPRPYVLVLVVLIVATGIWHFGIARYSGFVMLNTGLATDRSQVDGTPTMFFLIDYADFYNIESRSPEVQKAFFTTWNDEPAPAKIELIANWLVVLVVTRGLYALCRRCNIDLQLKLMGVALFCLVGTTIFVPWLSGFYGVTRVLFTGFIVFALCFPLGVQAITQRLNVPVYTVMVTVLVLYAVTTSGIIYLPFGLEKTFPVVVTLK